MWLDSSAKLRAIASLRVVSSFASLVEDSLVDALLMEVAGLLTNLIERGQGGSIDLRGLPLSPSCIDDLKQRLGRGEIGVTLEAAGRSEIFETGFPGVWWTRHIDEAGREIATLIEVTAVPDIVRADPADMARGLLRLPAATHVQTFARARHA